MNSSTTKTILVVVAAVVLALAIQFVGQHLRISWVSPSAPTPAPPAPPLPPPLPPAPKPEPKPVFPSASLQWRVQHRG